MKIKWSSKIEWLKVNDNSYYEGKCHQQQNKIEDRKTKREKKPSKQRAYNKFYFNGSGGLNV